MRGIRSAYSSLVLCLLFSSSLFGHEVEQHFMRLTLADDHFSARFEMDAGYALPELRDNEDDTLPTGAWFSGLDEGAKARIQAEGRLYIREVLHFHLNGLPIDYEIEFAKWGTDWETYFEQRPDTFTRMVWNLRWNYDDREGDLELFWLENEDGPSLALETVTDKRKLALVTVSQGEIYSIAHIDGVAQSEPVVAEKGFPFFGWLRQGFLHVVPQGLDHILFILGIFLLSPRLKPLLTQSLVFTLAHSITLGLTVAGKIPFNGNIIEPLIALSIAYVAIENLFLKELKPWRLGLIFALGLLHGMGFGSVMSELPVETSQLLVPIVGFNLGVEAAQVMILLVAVALTFWWRETKGYRRFRIGASLLIAATGLFWTVERIF